MSESEKGKFSTEISDQVLQEALEAVERHEPESESEPEPEVEVEVGGPDAQALRAQLEVAVAQGQEAHEKMLRAAADLENFKKRAQKEKEEIQKFGAERLLRDLLPVIDNLERALEHAQHSADFESLRQGVAMTRKQFEDALGKHGVKGFSALGQPFDPRLHEAMQQVETAELPPNHVASELVRGYTLNERLIRPALVAVSTSPSEPATVPAEVEVIGGSES